MRLQQRFFASFSQVAAAGVMLVTGVLSGCAANPSIREVNTTPSESTLSLIATIREIDAARHARIETATLALG